jgi:hypothetical protein
MNPRIFDTDAPITPHGESWNPTYEPRVEDDLGDHNPNWLGTMAIGGFLIFVGLAVLALSPAVGLGFAFVGMLLIVGAYFARNSDIDWGNVSDEYAQWPQMEENLDWEQEARAQQEARQREIDEIVKAVKTTIRIRCRYCGTLNEEKANKCEACGASL